MKKVITVIVLLAFLAVSVFAAPASAVITEAVLVAGGVMTVGLVASTVICAAAGGGMNSVINEKASSLGVTSKSFIEQKIGEYCQETGMSTPNLLRLFMSGTAISPGNPFDPGTGAATAGNLLLTGSLALWLTGFFSWLWNGESNDDKLIDEAIYEEASYPETFNYQGHTLYLVSPVETDGTRYFYEPFQFSGGNDTNRYSQASIATTYNTFAYCYCFEGGTYGYVKYWFNLEKYIGAFNPTISNVKYYFHQGTNGSTFVSGTNYTYGISDGTIVWKAQNGYGTSVNVNTSFLGGLNHSIDSILDNANWHDIWDAVEGEGAGYRENPLIFDPDKLGKPLDRFVVGIGETVEEDTDDPDFPPDVIVGKIPVGDYIEQVAGIYSGTDTSLKVETDEGIVDVPVELTDAGTGVIEDAGSIPVVIADEQDVVVADSEQVAEATEDMELDEYTLDLKDFFPFCVPFDIYNMLQLFSDTAEAPNFDWRFYVPDVMDYTLEIDLSSFDPLAEILRRLELVAFAVALAFATKNIIQGGD